MNKNVLIVLGIGIVAAAGIFLLRSQNGDEVNSEMLKSDEKIVVQAADVEYAAGMYGHFAKPAKEGNYPGVVMIHEWWGLNENIKQMARELAKEGYLVLAVDLFGKVAATPEEARAQVGALDQKKAIENLRAAAAFLRERGATKMGSLGWCFGGGQSLKLALSGEPLDATVIYYGTLVTDEKELAKIAWPVLGIFGDKDTSIPVATVTAFRDALDAVGVHYRVFIYPGVGHAFANPSGANYAPNETKDAWTKTLQFLEEYLK